MKLPDIEYKNCIITITVLPDDNKWKWSAIISNLKKTRTDDKQVYGKQSYDTKQEAIDHAKVHTKQWVDDL